MFFSHPHVNHVVKIFDIGGNAKTSQMADAIAQLAKQKLGK